DQSFDDRLRGIVDLDELDAHPGRRFLPSVGLFPLPNDASHSLQDTLLVSDLHFELEERPGRKGRRRLDEHHDTTHVVGVMLDEFAQSRASIADRHAEHFGSRFSARVLTHVYTRRTGPSAPDGHPSTRPAPDEAESRV